MSALLWSCLAMGLAAELDYPAGTGASIDGTGRTLGFFTTVDSAVQVASHFAGRFRAEGYPVLVDRAHGLITVCAFDTLAGRAQWVVLASRLGRTYGLTAAGSLSAGPAVLAHLPNTADPVSEQVLFSDATPDREWRVALRAGDTHSVFTRRLADYARAGWTLAPPAEGLNSSPLGHRAVFIRSGEQAQLAVRPWAPGLALLEEKWGRR